MAAIDTPFTDDVVWHLAGRGAMAGDFTGKEQGFCHLDQFMERSGRTYKSTHDFLASDEHGVVMFAGTGSREGQPLYVRFVDIYHVTDGRSTVGPRQVHHRRLIMMTSRFAVPNGHEGSHHGRERRGPVPPGSVTTPGRCGEWANYNYSGNLGLAPT